MKINIEGRDLEFVFLQRWLKELKNMISWISSAFKSQLHEHFAVGPTLHPSVAASITSE